MRGFSLIEILLVIGIIMLLAISGFVLYDRTMTSRRINQEIMHLASIEAGVKSVFPLIGSNYSTLPAQLTELFNKARIIPSSMNGNDYTRTTITHPWGGTVSMHVTSGDHGQVMAGKGIAINYLNIPSDICIGLVTKGIQRFKSIRLAYGEEISVTHITPMSSILRVCNSSETGTVHFILD